MGKKLLLADDSITIQKVVELILADEDFEIKSVGDGEQAWTVMKEFMPDIVLADIEMPKLNGYQLCEKIKKDELVGGVPVILLAGAFEPIDEDLMREVGADDYIVKPFESQELISKINAVLAERELKEEVLAEAVEEESAAAEEEALEIAEPAEEVAGSPEEAVELAEEAVELAEPVVPESDVAAEGTEEVEGESWDREELDLEPSEETVALEEELSFKEDDATLESIEEIDITREKEGLSEPREGAAAAAGGPEGTVSLPEPEEMKALFKAVAEEKISAALESLDGSELYKAFTASVEERLKEMTEAMDLQTLLLENVKDIMRPTIEKIVIDTAPRLMEEMVREMMEELSASLKQQVEKIIWETVPDIAETIINREVEGIKAAL